MTLKKDDHLKNQILYITNNAYDELQSSTDNIEVVENEENEQEMKEDNQESKL